MVMNGEPKEPRVSPYYGFFRYLQVQQDWRKFVPGYDVAG